MTSLFNSNIKNKNELENWKAMLPNNLQESYCIVCVITNNTDSDYPIPLTMLERMIDSTLFTKYIIYDDELYFLIDNIESQNMIPQINFLEKQFKPYRLKIGSSLIFKDLLDANIYRKQASIAAHYSDGKKSVNYINCALKTIGKSICDDLPLQLSIHPAFGSIREYDGINDTEYEKTLISYIINLHDQKKIADELNIHRNTVSYRIAAIERIANIKLNDFETITHLTISYIIQSSRDECTNEGE